MTLNPLQFDAIVIGAGAGGVSAAARLTQAGYRTLLVESCSRVGGRALTREVDGFLLNTGALAIERDGAVAELYKDLGLELNLWLPQPQTALLWGRRVFGIDPGQGLIGVCRTMVPNLLQFIGSIAPGFRPEKGESNCGMADPFHAQQEYSRTGGQCLWCLLRWCGFRCTRGSADALLDQGYVV